MLSYRHGFHAGNHADVLKHFVLVQILDYLNQKDAAYTIVDTHAGAGLYTLESGFAAKTGEYQTGIARLWGRDDIPAALQSYLDIVASLNPDGHLRHYPGSPYFAEQLMREQDRLRLFELHPTESKVLQDNCAQLEESARQQGRRNLQRGKPILVTRQDGFDGMKSLLPPPSRRALVLIDPPYEIKDDYKRVKSSLEDALKRFPTGVYAVWYPVLQRNEARQFAEKLKRLPCKSWLNVTLAIHGPMPDGIALHNSGMFIVNPPWTLYETLEQVMPYLNEVLQHASGHGFVLESGENE